MQLIRNITSTAMNLVLATVILAFVGACSPQISVEQAAERAAEDRANHQAYLQEQYDDEKFCETFGCE